MERWERRRLEKKMGLPTAGEALADAQAILSGQEGTIAAWLAATFNKNFDDYDRAIDAVYNATHVGGSRFHHIVDGQHTLFGAFKAVEGVRADDSFIDELMQASEHLVRDTASVSGINPFFGLSPDQFDSLAACVQHLGVSKIMLADALTVNGPEVIGGILALGGGLKLARDKRNDDISNLAGACMVSSLISANPLLLTVAATGLVYAIKQSPDVKSTIIKSGKGALVSGSAIAAGTMLGGTLWTGCLASMATAVAVRYCLDKPDKALERANSIINEGVRLSRIVKCSCFGVKA